MKNSLTRQSALLISAGLFALAAIWRAIIAIQHYRFSLTIIDDPSMRELEQLGAFFEASACLILLLHAAVLAIYSRRTLKIFWPLVAVTGLLCATIMAGSLSGHPLFSLTGIHAVAIVTAVAVACAVMRFNWASLYTGALLGSTLGWLATTPQPELFTGLFVIGPVLVYALLGGALASILKRRAKRDSTSG